MKQVSPSTLRSPKLKNSSSSNNGKQHPTVLGLRSENVKHIEKKRSSRRTLVSIRKRSTRNLSQLQELIGQENDLQHVQNMDASNFQSNPDGHQ